MSELKNPTIYTVGHSTHTLVEFLEMLASFEIKVIADVRRLPGSRKYPQFDQESLKKSLAEVGIQYLYFADLGGRRIARKDTKNTRWNNASFRGYADYMESDAFKNAVVALEDVALEKNTAYMCSEAVWWRCHRSMISDYLKAADWTVLHIMAKAKIQEHPYTQPARIVNGCVLYSDAAADET